MELKRVVVTGLGAITPLGNTVPEYWDGLSKGVSGADYIKQFDCAKFKTRLKTLNPPITWKEKKPGNSTDSHNLPS
jgi:3-oxoacyl-(acyl-carrier-protein) synthase